MIQDLEAELTGSAVDALNNKYSTVAEQINTNGYINAIAKASNDT